MTHWTDYNDPNGFGDGDMMPDDVNRHRKALVTALNAALESAGSGQRVVPWDAGGLHNGARVATVDARHLRPGQALFDGAVASDWSNALAESRAVPPGPGLLDLVARIDRIGAFRSPRPSAEVFGLLGRLGVPEHRRVTLEMARQDPGDLRFCSLRGLAWLVHEAEDRDDDISAVQIRSEIDARGIAPSEFGAAYRAAWAERARSGGRGGAFPGARGSGTSGGPRPTRGRGR